MPGVARFPVDGWLDAGVYNWYVCQVAIHTDDSHKCPGNDMTAVLTDEIQPESFSARVTRLWQQYVADVEASSTPDELMDDMSAMIANTILDELGVSGDAVAVLHLCVKEGVRHRIRAIEQAKLRQREQQDMPPQQTQHYRDRLHERRERAGTDLKVRPQSIPTPDITNPLAFLEMFVTCSGSMKKWKFFTTQELEERRKIHSDSAKIAFQIERSNTWAIETCERHSAACLADISLDTLIDELPDEEIRP